MANRIISFGDIPEEPQGKYSLEVYNDISTSSAILREKPRIQKNINAIAVKDSLKNIFTWIPGERILLPEFGSRLYSLLYEGIIPETEEQIVAEIHRSVTEWEPRANIVEIRNIGDVDDTEDNTIHLEIVFTVNGLDDKQYVYSFVYNKVD